jgi:hypothetical protein
MSAFARRLLLRIDDVLKEGYCDVFFIRQNARQLACEMAYLTCQRDFAVCIDGVSDVEPAVDDCLAGFKQFGSRWFVE